jgi:hypothetical protein
VLAAGCVIDGMSYINKHVCISGAHQLPSEKRQKYVRHRLLSVVLSYNMVVFHHESFRQHSLAPQQQGLGCGFQRERYGFCRQRVVAISNERVTSCEHILHQHIGRAHQLPSEKRQKYVRHRLLSVVLSYNMVVFHHATCSRTLPPRDVADTSMV